jgi:hypothetical protein
MTSHGKSRAHKWFTTFILCAVPLAACNRNTDLPTDPALSMDLLENEIPLEVQELLKVQLVNFSTMPMLLMADILGVTEIEGKSLKQESQDASTGPKRLIDVPISADLVAHENEPTVATSPKNKKLLVSGYQSQSPSGNVVRCHARRSSDGGMSWSAPFAMPQLGGQCSDPVLAYAPDGSRVFYAYMDVKTSDWDILVSYSDNNGATWRGPFIALDGIAPGVNYDKPWIGTPDDESNIVYVTATRFDMRGVNNCSIVFTRSVDGGDIYEAPRDLDTSSPCGVGPLSVTPLVQGSRPSGGKNGNVLVAWYHSGFDGVRRGSFMIRTRYSADFGTTFGPIVDAATDLSEAQFFKGPDSCYERWWMVMFPDVELDPSQGGHIAYTHDPQAGGVTAEEGDIRYITSPGPPYTIWSAPETVNDDRTVSAQGFAALDIMTEQTGQSSKPHLAWMDHRLPAAGEPLCFPDVENLFYDIFYTTRENHRWKENNRITEESSRSDVLFLGDYIDLTTDNGSLYTVWTDRRDKLSLTDREDDVWGSRTHRTQSLALTSP